MAEPERASVFISYSRTDSKWMDSLITMLATLIHTGVIEVWWDTLIKPGQQWLREIEKAIAVARVGLLLVSADFLASNFIREKELPVLLNMAQAGRLTLMWALVRNCPYEDTVIKQYQAAHYPIKPWNSLTEAQFDEVLKEVCFQIKTAVESPRAQQQSTEQAIPELPTVLSGTATALVEPPAVLLQPISDMDRPASPGRIAPPSDESAKKILTHVNNLEMLNDIGSIYILKEEWSNAIYTFHKLVNLATPTRQDWIAKGYKTLGLIYKRRWNVDRRREDFRQAYQCWTLSKNLYLYRGQQEHAAEVQSWLVELAQGPPEENAVKKSG